MQYLTDSQAKAKIIEVGRRMFEKDFVAANDGNITCRVAPDIIWTTPTGVSKGDMTEDMLIKMDLNGKVLSGTYKPSSEVKMHLRVYRENSEVCGVTHAHPPVSTAFAIAGIALDSAIYPEALINLGTVPVAKYATPGTQEVPDSIAPYCRDYNAVLLANHGALTWGRDLTEAWYRMESLEHYALILMYTSRIIGKSNILSCHQVQKLVEIRENLGVSTGGYPPCAVCPSNNQDVVRSSGGEQGVIEYPAAKQAEESLADRITREVMAALQDRLPR